MNLNDIIKIPYTTRPHMQKNAGDAFNRFPDINYISLKKDMLNCYQNDLCIDTDNELTKKVASFLGLSSNNIKDLALSLEEDIAILHQGILTSICFCFPSSWIPVTAVGKSLTQIHMPVADGDHLRSASEKITKIISDPVMGSFKRYVWTINKVQHLSNYYKINETFKDKLLTLDNLFFRTETQTTLPLPDCTTCIFFVKVDVIRLSEVWNDNRELILASINSMSDAILTYKNLHEIKKYLNKCAS